MNSHYELSDIAFETQFEKCTLSPSLFNHDAHLRLAWIHITKYGIDKALTNIQVQLQQFVSHVGASDKYNKTLTIAAIKAVYHFTLKSKAISYTSFINEFPQLIHNFSGLMETHYSMNIFSSQHAKKEYIIPDLIPFDC